MACDHKVNWMLKEFGATFTARGLADPFPFPAGAYCCDPQYKEDSEEAVYNKLVKLAEQKTGGKSTGGASGAQQRPFGEFLPSVGQSPATAKQQQRNWERTLIQSVHAAKSQDKCPAGIERMVNQMINPKVAWQEILRSLLREQCSDDWDFLTPAMEYSESDFILPSMRSDRIGTVVAAEDTSGSVDNALLADFKGELQHILDHIRPRKLVEFCCDSKIHAVNEYVAGDTIKPDGPGGGGTSFRPVMKRCQKMDPQPKCLVYLTDGVGDFGEDPGFPVIWVVYGGHVKQVPYGQLVEVGHA